MPTHLHHARRSGHATRRDVPESTPRVRPFGVARELDRVRRSPWTGLRARVERREHRRVASVAVVDLSPNRPDAEANAKDVAPLEELARDRGERAMAFFPPVAGAVSHGERDDQLRALGEAGHERAFRGREGDRDEPVSLRDVRDVARELWVALAGSHHHREVREVAHAQRVARRLRTGR